jgi:hypothetical protein
MKEYRLSLSLSFSLPLSVLIYAALTGYILIISLDSESTRLGIIS